MAQFAKRLGLHYGWLVRITTKGVKQTSKRTLPQLQKLAEELGFDDHTSLWGTLPESLNPKQVVAEFKKRYPAQWTLFLAWKYASTEQQYHASVPEDAESSLEIAVLRHNREVGNAVTVEEYVYRMASGIHEKYRVFQNSD